MERLRGLCLVVALVASLTGVPTTALAADKAIGPDFNGDGIADLAIGVPFQDAGAERSAGVVHVVYGTDAGFDGDTPIDDQIWSQDSTGIADETEPFDFFGEHLAAGDFNGDGYADLAIGVAGEDLGANEDAGAVHVLIGGPTGLSAKESRFFTQDTPEVLGTAAADDHFGAALAAGDFNGDGRDDLAIGVYGDDPPNADGTGFVNDGGAVNVLYGNIFNLETAGNQIWHQNSAGIPDQAEAGDHFGVAVAAANLGRGTRDDLAIGAPGESVGSIKGAGAINVIFGRPGGLNSLNAQLWHQDSPDIRGRAQTNDHFGSALAAADFGGTTFDDIAIGVPDENVSGESDAGAVNVIYGSTAGLSAFGNQVWTQGSSGIRGGPEEGDSFGLALAAGDLGMSGHADLVIGVPWEDEEAFIDDTEDVGAVNVIYGSSGGLTEAGDQLWSQASSGIAGETEDLDRFGHALAVGQFGKGATGDLAVGVPGEQVTSDAGEGAVNVIFGTPAGLAAAGDQLLHQDLPGFSDTADGSDGFGYGLAGDRS